MSEDPEPDKHGIYESTVASAVGDDSTFEAASKVPALYTDAYYLNYWTGHIRIALGEALGGKSHYRTAVVLPIEDAESLAADLTAMVKELREKTDKKT
jgi:hypothetical protein